MAELIGLRLATRIGAWTAKLARRLAEQVRRERSSQRSQIVDGFLLRGVRAGRQCKAMVIDPPSYVLFAGFASFRAGTPTPLTLGYGAMAAGGRDDVWPPGTAGEYNAAEASSFLQLQIPSVPSGPEPAQVVFFPPVQQLSSLITAGYLAMPLLRTDIDSSFDPLDDMRFFTFAQVCQLGGGFTSIADSGIRLRVTDDGAEEGDAPVNYRSRVRYFIDEADLADGWRLHSRRQVPHTDYSPVLDPEYFGRIGPGILQIGLGADIAEPQLAAEGIDRICLAARAFRQYVGSWYITGSGPTYRPQFYDRYGYQGLLVSIGQYDRADYPGSGFANFSQVVQFVVTPEDLPLTELKPLPATTPANAWGKPELPGFGQFLVPHAVMGDSGFVVFSIYTTFRNASGDPEPDADEPLAGDAYALLVTLEDGATENYAADWDCGPGATLMPGSAAGYFAQPWLVGAASVQAGGRLAVALTWEHHYSRRSSAEPRGTGGEWVLYLVDASDTDRVVLDGAGAPLFAAIMQRKPTQFSQLPFDEDQENAFSTLQDAGGGLLVTAAVDNATPVVSGTTIPAEEIRCAVVDIAAGTVELRGTIATRNRIYTKCHISVVQPYRAAVGDRPARQPVLLATIADHLLDGRGVGGKVCLSLDGGATWRDYIQDGGAPGGAFFAGNRLWRFSTDQPLSRGIAGDTP